MGEKGIIKSIIKQYQDSIIINLQLETTFDLKFTYFLFYKGRIVQQTEKNSNPYYTFIISRDGDYYVRFIIEYPDSTRRYGVTNILRVDFMMDILNKYDICFVGNRGVFDQLQESEIGLQITTKVHFTQSILEEIVKDQAETYTDQIAKSNTSLIIIDLMEEALTIYDKFSEKNKSMLQDDIYEMIYIFVHKLRDKTSTRCILLKREYSTKLPIKKDFCRMINYILEIFYDAMIRYYGNLYQVPIKLEITENINNSNDIIILDTENTFDLLINRIKEKDKIFVRVTCSIKDSILHGFVTTELADNYNYLFILYKDGIVYDQKPMNPSNEYDYKVTEAGIYCLKVIVKNDIGYGYNFSKTISYFTEKEINDYKEFMTQTLSENNYVKQLDYFTGTEPYHDFAVVTKKGDIVEADIQNLAQFVERNCDLNCTTLNLNGTYKTVVISDTLRQNKMNENVILSGHCIVGNQYLLGTKDIIEIEQSLSILESIGAYATFIGTETQMFIATDYFHSMKIYYFQDEEYFIASNRYHLLLMIAKNLKRSLHLDIDKATVVLSSATCSLLNNNIFYPMNINPVKEMRSDCMFVFDDVNGWIQKETGLAIVNRKHNIYHKEEYDQLLVQSKNEILNNLVAISKHYNKIVVDLSGGMDSRVVYSAVTNFPELKDKIYIRANKNSTPDINIAVGINQVFAYQYDNLPSKQIGTNVVTMNQMTRSLLIGGKYTTQRDNTVYQTDCIRLTGGSGEMVARPNNVRRLYNKPISYIRDMDTFVEELGLIFSLMLSVDYDKAFYLFDKYMKDDLSIYPSEELLEKYEYNYLAYVDGYHIACMYNYLRGMPDFRILHSKTLYQLHTITRPIFKDTRLEFDLTYELNPLLGMIQYDLRPNNQERNQRVSELRIKDNRFQKAQSYSIEPNYDEWEIMNKDKIENKQVVNEEGFIKDISELDQESSGIRRTNRCGNLLLD